MKERHHLNSTQRTFQSLFLWIFRSYEVYEGELVKIDKLVSILVLMDLPFLLFKNKKYYLRLGMVSILVLMDLPFLR